MKYSDTGAAAVVAVAACGGAATVAAAVDDASTGGRAHPPNPDTIDTTMNAVRSPCMTTTPVHERLHPTAGKTRVVFTRVVA
jgi:hypothetical protein